MLVNSSPVVVKGLTQVLDQDDMQVCGDAIGLSESMDAIRAQQPDLAIVDISSHGGAGTDVVRAIRTEFPKLVILVLSMHDESFYAEYMLRAGASGFVALNDPTDQLVLAVRRSLDTGMYVSGKIAEGIVSRFVDNSQSGTKGSMRFFSDREFEVFDYIGQGMSVRQIAEKLNRSIKTIEAHRENIKKKLHLDTTAELLRNAIHWVEYRREV